MTTLCSFMVPVHSDWSGRQTPVTINRMMGSEVGPMSTSDASDHRA
jgi:hypothetical protein